MEHINKVAEVIKSQLIQLQFSISGKKSAIEDEYKSAVQLAETTKKEAINIAEKTRKEALKEFENEEIQITTLSNALKTLGVTSKPEKKAKPLAIPKVFETKLSVNQKIAFALNEIGSGFKEDIAKVIAEYDNTDVDTVTKKISGVLSAMKKKGQLTAVKDGRRDKYSLVG